MRNWIFILLINSPLFAQSVSPLQSWGSCQGVHKNNFQVSDDYYALSVDGTMAVVYNYPYFYLWNTKSGNFIRSFIGNKYHYDGSFKLTDGLCISHDNKHIIFNARNDPFLDPSTNPEYVSVVWDIKQELPVFVFEDKDPWSNNINIPYTKNHFALRYSLSSKHFEIWDYLSNQILDRIDVDEAIYSLCLFADDKQVAVGTESGHVYIYDLTTRSLLRSWQAYDAIPIGSITASADNSIVITAPSISYEHILVWDLVSMDPLFSLHKTSNCIMKCADASLLMVYDVNERRRRIYDLSTLALLSDTTFSSGYFITHIANNGATLFHDTQRDSLVLIDPYPNNQIIPLFSYSNEYTQTFLSPNDSLLVAFHYSKEYYANNWSDGLSIYNAVTGKRRYDITYPIISHVYRADMLACAAFSPDNRLLAVSFNNGNIYLYNVGLFLTGQTQTPPILLQITPDMARWNKMTFTPDGNYLVIAGVGEHVLFFDWRNRIYASPWVRNNSAMKGVLDMSFSPDGEILTLATRNGYDVFNHDGSIAYTGTIAVNSISPLPGSNKLLGTTSNNFFILNDKGETLRTDTVSLRARHFCLLNDGNTLLSFYETKHECRLFDLTDSASSLYLPPYYIGNPIWVKPRHAIGTHDGKSVIIIGEDNSIQRFDLNFSTTGIASPPAYSNATSFSLDAPYPNPAGGSVQVNYNLQRSMPVSIQVHDHLGRIVQSLQASGNDPGGHTTTVDVSGFTPGVYFIVMQSGKERVARSIVVER